MITNLVILTITAYCHCSICCGIKGQPTASGIMPRVGTTIAAPRNIPFGSLVIFNDGKTRIVQDRLARKYDNRLDIFMSSHARAKKFGIKKQQVKIVTIK